MPMHATRRTVLAAGAAVALAGCAGTLLDAPAATLPGTHQLDLRDPASGLTWRVWVQRPAGPAPAGGHPVMYVLDGNAAFPLAAQLARHAAARPAPLRPDAAIVVGIGHAGDSVYAPGERQRDYTPAPAGQAGGADLLLDFIAREVQPRIGQVFAVDPQRQTISGHSFGGLFVLHTLFNRPALFTRYVAASPSIWWNDAQLLRAAEQFIARHAAAPRPFRAQVRLLAGGLETAAAAATPARAATQRERRMLERAEALAQRLEALKWPELQAQYTVLDGLDHGAVMLPALVDALAFAQRPL